MANKGVVFIANEAKKETAKLEKLADRAGSVIYELSSVFPFQLFPDKIIIDENKITIVRKEIFFKRIIPIMHRDILSIKVNRGILFAAMEFEVRRFHPNPRPISYLRPAEAAQAQKYIMGLVEARRAKVDLTKVPIHKEREQLEEAGMGQDDSETLF